MPANATHRSSAPYTARIIKAGALIGDTKTLLSHWDLDASVDENLSRVRRENVFGKASRSRVEDILGIFRQRYLSETSVTKALVTVVRGKFPTAALERLFYFHSARNDRLLHDAVTEILVPMQARGLVDIHVQDFQRFLTKWVEEGKTNGHWSESTITRIAQGLLSALRDFGVLQGAVNKKIAPSYLPIESFAYPTLDALRRDMPRLILASNLHGIDIDLRASQIAAMALWLRCQRVRAGENRRHFSRCWPAPTAPSNSGRTGFVLTELRA
jgi:hypothetical protein